MISEDDVARLRRLMEARDKRDRDKVALTNSENEYREIESEIHESLSTGPVNRLNNVDLGDPWGKVSFQSKETVFGKILDEEELLEWFEQRAMVDEVSAPKFVKARVNEIARQYDESGEKMPPGLTATRTRYVQITRQKGG